MRRSSPTRRSADAYRVGERVGLFVDPNDADNVVIDSFAERFFLPSLFGGLGALAAVIAVIEHVRRRRR